MVERASQAPEAAKLSPEQLAELGFMDQMKHLWNQKEYLAMATVAIKSFTDLFGEDKEEEEKEKPKEDEAKEGLDELRQDLEEGEDERAVSAVERDAANPSPDYVDDGIEGDDFASKLESAQEIPDVNERVLKVCHLMVEEQIKGKHCWDWVAKVYRGSNAKRSVIFKSYTEYEGHDCGENFASDELVNGLEPGDHIFINNKNKYDRKGNHSVIFLGWANQGSRIAKLAGYPGKNRPPVLYKRNLFKAPVTYIAKARNKGAPKAA